MKIVKALQENTTELLSVHEKAFGEEKGGEIRQLVADLLEDKTAEPIYSFVAIDDEQVVGHILFTQVTVVGASRDLSAQLLAPLAVLPEYQSKGVGAELINRGLAELKKAGVELALVLGHPGYYPRCGFINDAAKLGFEAPYPIPPEYADAWMVQELTTGVIGHQSGKVRCSDVLNEPQHWRE